ncbi:BnaAnng33410D [Brassica napus]|uniref:BnaAnng33410D protein n=1 Tax=Brassica napus TaxID=3708 RepID=A0A078JVA2_BRANA|nr:BnaAnng33410D [Brassica napus]
MQSTTLSGNYGFPLCISRIAQQLSISKEMSDHDRRRKGMKKRRRSEESMSHGEEEMVGMRESEDARDLIALFQDLVSWSFSSHTAKAA